VYTKRYSVQARIGVSELIADCRIHRCDLLEIAVCTTIRRPAFYVIGWAVLLRC